MHTNNNQRTFFELVSAGLFPVNGERFTVNGSVDWDVVYQMAEEQSVVGLVAAGIDSFKIKDSSFKCPQEWALQFIGATLQIEQRNKAMNAFIADLISKMRKAGIYTLLLKGQGVAQCYEKPTWRACGDVDLFLGDDNYEKAKAFLIPLASSVEEEYEREKHLGMTIDGWVVELHGRLYSGLSSRIERELDRVYHDTFFGGTVRSWNCVGVQVFLLKEENDVFYVFTHILQHFYKEGVGLRQICDWSRLLWTYRDKLDLKLLESHLRKAGLMSEWKAFYMLAIKYLGMPDVVQGSGLTVQGSKWERKADRIMKFILMSGNMGHNREKSYSTYPYLVRKCFSAGRRLGDLFNHAMIFPMDSLRFSFTIMKNGVSSAIKGEG